LHKNYDCRAIEVNHDGKRLSAHFTQLVYSEEQRLGEAGRSYL